MMQKNCKQCTATFQIDPTDQAFYKKLGVPPPTCCPDCRMQRRLSYRNDRSLYQSQSSLSGKKMLSMYNPEYGYTVYDQEEWWSDSWDPLDLGKEFDFSRSFFEQLAELQKTVPRFNLFNKDSVNCDYVNYAPHCKNCYLLFGSWFSEDCLYGQTTLECHNCMDTLYLEKSELCYENVDCANNYQSLFCQNSSNLNDCYFCYDCKNCEYCIGCWNLKNKKYHIKNQAVTREEFVNFKKQFASYKILVEAKKSFQKALKEKAIYKSMIGMHNENVSGDYIFNCKNAKFCFSAYRSEDVAYSGRMLEQKDSYDFEGGGKGELLYESMSNDFAFRSIGSTTCEHLVDSHYCDICYNCEHCFGCIGLRHKKYCIFNKQYTKDAYDELLPKIIQHMKEVGEFGEFYPIANAPFAYNETMAQEYFPIGKDVALKNNWKWKEEAGVQPQKQTYIIPDNIHDVSEDILSELLQCIECNKNFKIIPQELAFYKKMNIALARKCHNCRHKERFQMRNPRKLWERKCMKCEKEIQTTYEPERPERVYCEECYLKEVY